MTQASRRCPSARTEWRSLLFVPADNQRALAKAAGRDADALIIDLEDAVAAPMKARARETLGATIAMLRRDGQRNVIVRVNATEEMRADIMAAIAAGADAIMLPKTESVSDVAVACSALDAAETHEGSCMGIVALIESPAGVLAAPAIASAPRVVGLALGSEDFGLALDVPPGRANLMLPCQMLALAAATQSIAAIGLPVSLARFGDMQDYSAAAAEARAIGLTGAMCIHPAQIDTLNVAFGNDPTQEEWARNVIAAWAIAQSQGRNVASLNGSMIDEPVVARANAILKRGR